MARALPFHTHAHITHAQPHYAVFLAASLGMAVAFLYTVNEVRSDLTFKTCTCRECHPRRPWNTHFHCTCTPPWHTCTATEWRSHVTLLQESVARRMSHVTHMYGRVMSHMRAAIIQNTCALTWYRMPRAMSHVTQALCHDTDCREPALGVAVEMLLNEGGSTRRVRRC